MKKFLSLIFLAAPFWIVAQPAQAPKKNKFGVYFMTPKTTTQSDFERNLSRHSKDFHKDQSAVDIYEVVSGNRTGEFQMVYRNNSTWAEMDAYSGVMQKDHATDWEKNISIYLAHEGPFYIFENSDDSYLPANMAEMASAPMWGLYFIELNPGMEEDFAAGLKKIKEMYQKNNSKNYYFLFNRVFGKGSLVGVAFPLNKGWASLEPDPNEDWEKLFKNAFPKEDYKVWMKKFNSSQKSFESMLLRYRKDLSSPGM